MKIGVLTFHHVDNFGAVWQCYSMCSTLQRLGHQPFLVDYRPEGVLRAYEMPRGRFWLSMRMIAYFKKRSSFNRFRSEHLPPQTARFTSLPPLRASPPEADAFIAGSDQIWNPGLLGESYDPTYFLPFGGSARRIAYAASFGESRPLELTEDLGEMLSRFDFISIREEAALQAVADHFNLKARLASDPVLLTKDYSGFLGRHRFSEDYVFCYNLFNRESTDRVCGLLAERRGCEIRRVNDDWRFWKYSSKQEYGIGPVRWLDLIHQAKFVISDSFHGTLFSVMFRKNFAVMLANEEKGGANRIVNLLRHLGLDSRIISDDDSEAEIRRRLDEPVDWQEVERRIGTMRRESFDFLETALAR